MLFELTTPHFLPGDRYAEAGEIIGTGRPPDEWVERRREEKKPVKISASFDGMTPTPQMVPLDPEAEAVLAEFILTRPEGWGIDPVEALPLCGGAPSVPL